MNKTVTHDDVLDRFIGKKGTKKRTEFENELQTNIENTHIHVRGSIIVTDNGVKCECRECGDWY